LQFYSPSSSCSLNIWFITSAMLFFFGYAAVSVSPLRHPSAGLFTSAAVFAYCTYYTWSALNSEPTGAECSASSVGANKAIQIVGFVIAILAVRRGCRAAEPGASQGSPPCHLVHAAKACPELSNDVTGSR
jgi:hypothetical protein